MTVEWSERDLYRTLSAPYPALQDAQKAMTAFLDEVKAAREKHRIADVHVICMAEVVGQELPVAMFAQMGDVRNTPLMLALACKEQEERHEKMREALKEYAEKSLNRADELHAATQIS